jgi:SAM-dependent methyltransferase
MSEQGHGQKSPRGNPGSGPGVITPDGCAVDFYALLPPGREPEIIHRAAGRAGASILELGSGTGRITGALAKLGHPVVAVDESPEMLARNRSAETVCARIEDLALGRTFDVVLLASNLLNAPDTGIRQALLLRVEHPHVGLPVPPDAAGYRERRQAAREDVLAGLR